jgi:hypothetical protein
MQLKITLEVQEPGETVFVETFYNPGISALVRGLLITREVERLLVAYPRAEAINIQIEKDRNGTQDLQSPSDSEY